jgi:FAD:protein FMN transferase
MPERAAHRRCAQLWLGTIVEIAAEAAEPALVDAAIGAAFAAIARIHRALSNHNPASELSRVNRRAAEQETAISLDLRAVLACALAVAERSDGAFDPTQGAGMAALGFLPPQSTTQRVASWRDVHLEPRGVAFARPLALDLGGIAKGYAVDCAVHALRAHGAAAGVVNAGGDLRVFGERDEAVHVRRGGAQVGVLPLVRIRDGAVASSAYASQRRFVAGRWATPLIEPRNGLPIMSTRTVSVVAPTCMVADALTKVVALRGRAATAALAAFGASASVLSPARGHWRCTRFPDPADRAEAA